MDSFEALMRLIEETWVCDETRYPELVGKSLEQRQAFVAKHSLFHIAKTTGKIAAVLEEADHTGVLVPDDVEELKTLAAKLFVNATKLVQETGLSKDELLKRAPTFVS